MAPWERLSRLLTLDTQRLPREEVVRRLKKIPKLEDKLKVGLEDSKNRAYALDVISALKLEKFIPILKDRVEKDIDGYEVLTLNTLLDGESHKSIGQYYLSLVKNNLNSVQPGALVAIIDSLGRWGFLLPEKQMESLLSHSYFEIRLSTLAYIRSLTLKFKKKNYLNFLPRFMDITPYQFRLKALYFFNELPGKVSRIKLINKCLSDKNALVRLKCRDFHSKWKEDK